MKKFAKLLAMVLAVSMVLTMFVGAFDYKDAAAIDEDKAAAVEAVYNFGIMQGNNKGEFNPKANLTRDEMAKIMFALKEAGLDASNKVIFSTFFDDAASIPAWSKGYIGYAFQNEILVGNAKNEVNALGTLTYVEAAIMLMRALGLEGEYYDAASDIWYDEFTGPKWYQNAVMAAVEYDLFAGLDIVDFKANITREDVAVMIFNTIVLSVEFGLEDYFSLASWVNGVVYGTLYDEETEETYLYLEGEEDGFTYPLGDLDPADYVGYECEFSYEFDGEDFVIINEIEVVAGTVINTTLGEITFAENDDEDLALYVGDEEIVLVENLVGYGLYMNSVEFVTDIFFTDDEEDIAEFIDVFVYEIENGNANQAVKLIVNNYSVAIFYAPYSIEIFDEELVEEGFEDGEWTGEWFYDGLKIDENLLGLKDGTLVAAQVIDGEIFIVGFPTEYAVTDLTVTYSAKDGYTIALDGEELVNKTGLDAVELWQMTLTEDKGTIIVYNGDLLAYVPFVEDEEEADVEIKVGFVTDLSLDFAVNPDASDEEENDTYIITATLNVVVNGVEDVYTAEFTADELPNLADIEGEFSEALVAFAFVDGELAGLTPVVLDMAIVDEMDAESIDGVEFEDIDEGWFVDATDKGIELGDIEVKPVEGKEYSAIYVDGNRVNKTDCVASFTAAIDLDEDEVADYVYMIVVYDPSCEFEPFINFIAE